MTWADLQRVSFRKKLHDDALGLVLQRFRFSRAMATPTVRLIRYRPSTFSMIRTLMPPDLFPSAVRTHLQNWPGHPIPNTPPMSNKGFRASRKNALKTGDHYDFARFGIPIIFYFNGAHADYHQPGDEVQKIRFDLLRQRAQLVFYT